ncbi:MAG: L-aspartate oxidase [Pseudomonadota bacterium]
MTTSGDLFPTTNLRRVDDIIIVGAGLAGLFCALRLAPRPVTVLAAADLGAGTSSAWAQGGIAAAVSDGDTLELHLADTVKAGAGLVDERVAKLMISEGPECVQDLLSYGVPFDHDLEGKLMLSREAAHSQARIIRVSGDKAGAAIMQALIAAVRATPSIHLLEGYVAEDILTKGKNVTGLVVRPLYGHAANTLTFKTKALVLATGGIGHLYSATTNPRESSGSGLGMAVRAGAAIRDAEFVQFHPTALDAGLDPAPLMTEALRGIGALLVDENGQRFMPAIHKDAELAPRDIVARAVFAQKRNGGAFLDAREKPGQAFENEFPTVFKACQRAGLDPSKQIIPVAPAAHYHMGGIATDANARTTLDNLWAIGEVACTGVHGANRLASNSLLESVVFAGRAAEDIKSLHLDPQARMIEDTIGLDAATNNPDEERFQKLRYIMNDNVGVIRNEAALTSAIAEIKTLQTQAQTAAFKNSLAAALCVSEAALERKTSIGAHYRSDSVEAGRKKDAA